MKKINSAYIKITNAIIISCLLLASSAFANETRIIGGTTAQENTYPWMASIHFKGPNGPFCGGSLIHSQWILTAAHCVTGKLANSLQVTLNEHNIFTKNGNEITSDISEIIIHDHYNDSLIKNDIALLKLSTPVPSSSISPISLAADISQLSAQQDLKVLGWGATFYNPITDEASNPSNTLKEVNVSFIPQTQCQNTFSSVDDSQVCAGDFLRDSCSGDSGGPLIINENNEWLLVGIVSYGDGCGLSSSPGVYTSVAYYTQSNSSQRSLSLNSWLLQTLQNDALKNGQNFNANSIQTVAVTQNASSSPSPQNTTPTTTPITTSATASTSSNTATNNSSSGGGSSNIIFILLMASLLKRRSRNIKIY